MKLVSDHGFPKGDGSHPDDDAFSRFKKERDYINQSGRMKTTVAAMDWAAAEIDKLRTALENLLCFLDNATDYELQHAANYSAYLHAKAALTPMDVGTSGVMGKIT